MRISSEVLALPRKAVWPPEGMANGMEKKLMILINFAISCAEVGTKIACAGSGALRDLLRFLCVSTMLANAPINNSDREWSSSPINTHTSIIPSQGLPGLLCECFAVLTIHPMKLGG